MPEPMPFGSFAPAAMAPRVDVNQTQLSLLRMLGPNLVSLLRGEAAPPMQTLPEYGKVPSQTDPRYANALYEAIDIGSNFLPMGGPAKAAGASALLGKSLPAIFGAIPARSLGELRNAWTTRGVRNFIADRPARNQLQLSDLVVPKEQRGQGVGSEFMGDLTTFADANQRTVTLTPDASYGATSVNRLKDFYKRFGFVENKGKNKDFSISDSMYRPPKANEGTPETNVGNSGDVPTSGPGGIRAYHGSPHDFERFDLSKIGTGEGAQAYGHGLYFAENEATARSYRDALTGGNQYTVNDQFLDPTSNLGGGVHALFQAAGAGPKDTFKVTPELLKKAKDRYLYHLGVSPDAAEYTKGMDALLGQRIGMKPNPGKMYEVNINAHPDQFLDWDKPLSQQSDIVKDALNKAGILYRNAPLAGGKEFKEVLADIPTVIRVKLQSAIRDSGGDLSVALKNLQESFKNATPEARAHLQDAVSRLGEVGISMGKEMQPGRGADIQDILGKTQSGTIQKSQAADILREAGIPGIKYLDQGSRDWRILRPDESVSGKWVVGKWPGGGKEQRYFENEKEARAYFDANNTKNYVVFNDKLIDILRKYGLAGAMVPPAVAAATDANSPAFGSFAPQ